MSDPDLDLIVQHTQKLLRSLVVRTKLSTGLLNKPPVKFIRDVFKEVMAVTGFGEGCFEDQELEECSASRDNKLSFLSALLHLVAYATDDHSILGEIRVTKIAAGLEPDRTNLLLQRLHTAATDPDCKERWKHAVLMASEPMARLPQDYVPEVQEDVIAPPPQIISYSSMSNPVAASNGLHTQPGTVDVDLLRAVQVAFPEMTEDTVIDVVSSAADVMMFAENLKMNGMQPAQVSDLILSLVQHPQCS